MKNVVILGGSFDPIHIGHIDILKKAIKFGNFDEGWLLPARYPRWKKDCLSIKKRLKLLSLVCKNENMFKICKEEINSKSTNFTYDTMLKLKFKYPNDETIQSAIEILREEVCQMFGGTIYSEE